MEHRQHEDQRQEARAQQVRKTRAQKHRHNSPAWRVRRGEPHGAGERQQRAGDGRQLGMNRAPGQQQRVGEQQRRRHAQDRQPRQAEPAQFEDQQPSGDDEEGGLQHRHGRERAAAVVDHRDERAVERHARLRQRGGKRPEVEVARRIGRDLSVKAAGQRQHDEAQPRQRKKPNDLTPRHVSSRARLPRDKE